MYDLLVQVYFLIGYTEEMLSQWLKCPVKLELQVVQNPKDVIYKYIWNSFNVVDATRYHMTEIYLCQMQ